MEIRKTSERRNPLLERKEIAFEIDHSSSGTPRLSEVRKALATMHKVAHDVVYVTTLITLTGTNRTVGEAEIYDSPEKARLVIPKHIQTRNLPPEEEKTKQRKTPKKAT